MAIVAVTTDQIEQALGLLAGATEQEGYWSRLRDCAAGTPDARPFAQMAAANAGKRQGITAALTALGIDPDDWDALLALGVSEERIDALANAHDRGRARGGAEWREHVEKGTPV